MQGLLKKEARLYCLIFEQGHYFQTNFKIETFGYTLMNMEDWIAPHLTQLLTWLAFNPSLRRRVYNYLELVKE